jgi:peptidoglycan hydrolase-like amidase
MLKKIFLVLVILMLFSVSQVQAAECRKDCGTIDECQRYINECEEVLDIYEEANLKNKETLNEYKKQVGTYQALINSASRQINQLEEDIIDQEAELEVQQMMLGERIKRLYIHQRSFNILTIFFASENSGHFLRKFFYQQMVANEDKKAIKNLSQGLSELKENKKELEERQTWLANKKQTAEKQIAFLEEEVAKTEGYLDVLSTTVEKLSEKQKSLLAARSGEFTTSVGNVSVSKIPCSGPPGSPSYCNPGGGNWFAAFSFGGWTHRKGMSQYGAKGRAEAGQNYKDILKAYYGKDPVSKDTGGTISVSGYGNLNFEDYYLYGIAEMPSSWPKEALKAQAVAARTYAYRYKSEGRTICTTQSCQVFNNGKAASPPSGWKQAVDETRGQVLEDVVTYYSSTAGGYLTTHCGWDTECGDNGCWPDQAWEVKGDSPWFYSSWYTQKFTYSSAKCNRSHPWLNEEEMADILNAWLVLKEEGNDDRILPETINSCPIGGVSGDPYSKEELRNKANENGGAFTSVTSSSVSYSGDGNTSTVTFSTNKGSVSISGSDFKQAFNLRAPGYIAIRSPLFNIEKN